MSGPTPDKARLGVPDRWMYCPKSGKIVGNRFFPFKTPLCGLYDDQIEKRLRFHPDDVFNHPTIKGNKIGLWIDLTKTDRYYSPKEVEKHGCIYRKMPLAGHKASPTLEETDQFVRLVQGFVMEHPEELIGIHCTHGFNRTGFLISSYMVVIQDWAVDAAILQFAKQRPCGIYKQDYLADLFERYGDPDDCIEAPARPSWEFGESSGYVDSASTSTEEGNLVQSVNDVEDNSGKPAGKQFMDGLVKGVSLVTDQSKKKMLQGKIKELCGARRDGFPGLQPVSLEKSPDNDNLQLLAQKPYMVSWKADGMRYMIYICDENEIYAFDRDNEVFRIEGISFPHRKHPRHIVNTLVDAEMIIDHVKNERGDTIDIPRLLIYDIIHFEDMHVGKENFDIRFRCIKDELIAPRTEAMKCGRIRREREPISVRVKEFWELQAVPKLFEPKFTKNVGHEIDGLIFQPVDAPYTSGRCDIVLKWKPPSHNSIDFKLQIRKVVKEGELTQYIGYLYVQHLNEPLATMKATKKLLPYDNKIIECTFENKQWVFMRERTDKSLPNSVKTAYAVYNSMQHPIHKETLCRYVLEHGFRINPPSKKPKLG